VPTEIGLLTKSPDLSRFTADAVIVQHRCCAKYHRTPLSVATGEDSSYLKVCSPRSCMTIEANGAACERISERYQPDYSFADGQRFLAMVEKGRFLAVESGSNTRTAT